MMPLYLARIEGLGRGDLVKVDCVACHHIAHAGVSAAPRAQPSDQGARPEGARPVPRVWSERAGCGLDQVAAGRVNGLFCRPSA
jgi:hypothetical protein